MPPNVRPAFVHPIAIRELEVLRTENVTPGLRRVTLTGDQLGEFVSAQGLDQAEFVSTGFDDEVRLVFPYPGESEPVLPIAKPDGGLGFPEGRRPLLRVYTVRRYDSDRRELDIDFVVHGVGVAATWALRATPGDRLHVAGPYVSRGVPSDSDWMLVVGDETALPAISRLLDELPKTARAQVFIEVSEEAHRTALRELPGVDVTWVLPAGEGDDRLLQAVRDIDWPEGVPFAWIAGEQSTVRGLRRHLVEDRKVDKRRIDFTGYWKRGEVVALESDPSLPDPERAEDSFDKLYEQVEILPPLAIRAAVSLGLPDLISRGVRTAAALAEQTGANPRALIKLLRYLTAIDVLVRVGSDEFRLSDSGEHLAGDYLIEMLRDDGVVAQKERAFGGLRESLRTGASSYASVTGQDFTDLRRDERFEHQFLEKSTEYAIYTAEPLARAEALRGLGHIAVHSPIASVIAPEIVAAHPAVQMTIAALPAAASWLRSELSVITDHAQRARIEIVEQSVYERTPRADAVLLAQILDEHPDADAVLLLRRAAESITPGGRVLLLENVFDTEEFEEHDAEEDLLNLTLYGSGRRTSGELDALIEAADLRIETTEFVGFGSTLWSLVRR